MDPAVRVPMLNALGLIEPDPARRAAILTDLDLKFATYRTTTLVHILTGAAFLALVPLQLTSRLRTRRPKVHRVTGRIAIVLALASGLSGLFFGLLHPSAGIAEQVIVGLVGVVMISAIGLAFQHIRAGRVAEHREWMLRAIAAGLAVASVRIVVIPLDLALAPRGVDPRVILVLAMWLGWASTLAIAEWRIRSTRDISAPPAFGAVHQPIRGIN